MRFLVKLIILTFFVPIICGAQSISDIKKLEQMRTQIENAAKLKSKTESKISPASSLEVFQDKISVDKDSLEPYSDSLDVMKEEEEVSKDPFLDLPIFGHDVFENAKVDYVPEMYGPVDNLYPIGPGDELIISIWGEVELRHEIIVNRQGQIFVPEVGIVDANGLNLEQFKNKLIKRMGKSYSSILKNKAYLDVSLGKLRTIRVYVVGEVKKPGIFTVPALSSVFSLLFYAEGVKETASLRNITLVRNDKTVAQLDFYQFLTKGSKFSNVRLQNDDVIIVPPVSKRIYLLGAVNRPAKFDLLENDGLLETIEFSGGFQDSAYIEQVQIERFINNKDISLFDVNFKDLVENNTNFQLFNGDRILVHGINRELTNFIKIDGPIYGSSRFQYFKGMTLTDLFNRVDSLKGDAYLDRVQITRILPDRKEQIFSVNLTKILNKEQNDILLHPEDYIEVQSKNTLFPVDSVHVYGAINNTGTYALKKNMTLKDIIFSAGGFTKNAKIIEAEVSRIDTQKKSDGTLATIIYVPLDSSYSKLHSSQDEIFILKPEDNLFIRTNSEWELQRNVYVMGEVFAPGVYSMKDKKERVTDIIARAGGLKSTAYLDGAKLFRQVEDVGQIGIDFNEIFKDKNHEENIFLQSGDSIFIPEKLHTVKVIGAVNFPSSVLWEEGESLDNYIASAGGFHEMADENNVTIKLASGRVIKENSFLFWKYLPRDITPGSTIRIPFLTQKEEIDWSSAIRDAAAIMGSVATTVLIINQINNQNK